MNIAVYGVGGTGMNLLKKVHKLITSLRMESNCPFGKVTYYTADTSKANIDELPKAVTHWYPEGEDGAGKDFRESHRIIKDTESMASLMKTLPPADVNIILSSAGGGSGPILATGISNSILEKSKQPIHIMVGTESSEKEVSNAVKAVRMLENTARKHKVYIPIHFASLGNLARRDMVDLPAVELAVKLAMIFTGTHRELDASDIRNSLNPIRLYPDIKSGLALITLAEYCKENNGYVLRHSPYYEDRELLDTNVFMNAVDSTLTLRMDDDTDNKLALAQLVDGEGFYSSRDWGPLLDGSTALLFSQSQMDWVVGLLEDNLASYQDAVSRRKAEDDAFDGDIFEL